MLSPSIWRKALLLAISCFMLVKVALIEGAHAYVTNYSDGTVSVIDLTSKTVTSTISIGGKPFGMALSQDRQFALITNVAKPVIDVVDISTNTISKSLCMTSNCSWIATKANGTATIIIPAAVDDKTLYYYWLPELWPPREFKKYEHELKSGISGMTFSPNGKYLCISLIDSHALAIYEREGTTLLGIAEVGTEPNGIGITPDSKYAYVANTLSYGSGVSVVELSSAKTVATITVGSAPRCIAMATKGGLAYVTNNYSGNITVIDTETNCPIGTISVGGSPLAIALSKDNQVAYVTDMEENCVHIIDLSKNEVTDSISVGKYPMNILILD